MNRWLTSAVEAYIRHFGAVSEPLVYEVGSRDGNDGYELAQRISESVNDKNIVLFECNPPHAEAIRKNHPSVTLVTDAISDKKGTAEFLQVSGAKDIAGSSSLDLSRVKEPWIKDYTTIRVKTRRLDDVIESLGHQNKEIDIMKIDIEHYTWEALQGLGKYLRNVKVYHLETEVEGEAKDKTNLDIFKFMEERGYKCTALENEWGEHIQDQVWVRI